MECTGSPLPGQLDLESSPRECLQPRGPQSGCVLSSTRVQALWGLQPSLT